MFDIIVQPPLNRLVIFPCLPHSLLISFLPLRLTHRIMHDCLCLRHQLCKSFCRWVFCFCFLCFLAQLRLRTHSSLFPISRNPPCIVPLINIPLQAIHYIHPLRFHLFILLHYAYFLSTCFLRSLAPNCIREHLPLRLHIRISRSKSDYSVTMMWSSSYITLNLEK